MAFARSPVGHVFFESLAGSAEVPAASLAHSFRLRHPFEGSRGEEELVLDSSMPGPAPHLAGILDLSPRGPMLDRCRMRMRDLEQIGEGASPDGRPEACRLLAFSRRQRWRDGFGRRRARLLLRFRLDPLLLPRLSRFAGFLVARSFGAPLSSSLSSSSSSPRLHTPPSSSGLGYLYVAMSSGRVMVGGPRLMPELIRARGPRSIEPR